VAAADLAVVQACHPPAKPFGIFFEAEFELFLLAIGIVLYGHLGIVLTILPVVFETKCVPSSFSKTSTPSGKL